MEEINSFSLGMGEEQALLVIMNDEENADGMLFLNGDWGLISSLISTKGYVNEPNEVDKPYLNDIRKLILNTAYNMCNNDEKVKNSFLEGLLKLP